MDKMFLTLTGPSGVGKSALQKAVDRFSPDLLKGRPVLCHSRLPRTGEIHGQHYYFLPPALIKSLTGNDNFLVAPVRSDWQAIDLLQIADLLTSYDLVFAEVFYTFGPSLSRLASAGGVKTSSIFLLPTDMDPLTKSPEIVEMMQEKLISRGTDTHTKIKERALLAPTEMQAASQFTHRLINSASEDNIEEWGEFGKRGGVKGGDIKNLKELGPNARWLVETFVKIATGDLPPGDYRPPKTRYCAVLWDYPEGEPGGGGPNSTLSYEQLPKTEWFDSRAEALKAGEELNREWGNDFYVRIESEEYEA